ncbi:hypothetical protein GCM10029963_23800 [Micromonospora andamanensis]|uniref:hypothetical protein n=1 Tax=Micromonospora andamanensis TaxID=1287068 RepID=UPI001950D6DC|nr:hypothetical protein [Micromonospora andamanensis]
MGRAWLGLVLGVLLVVLGAALASDYRGLATKHVDMSMRTVRPISPFRSTEDRLARRRARFIVLDRIIGALTSASGAMALAAGAQLLLGEES